jgi:hypothetical protein
MMVSMRIGSTTWRRAVSGAIPLAFAAALPLVQWCPLDAEVSLLDCLLNDARPAAAAASAPACASDRTGCAAHGTAASGCPFERTRDRALCMGAPMGGAGLRPLAPDLHSPDLAPALPAMEPPEPGAPRELGRIDVSAEARPPTRAWARRPPVRGPPPA